MSKSSRFSSEWTKFEALFSQLVDDITCDGLQSNETRDAFKWFEQNDYYDCYEDPVIDGKYGTDIEENQCTWFIVKALEVASDEQREQLKVNYGKHDTEAVKKVNIQGTEYGRKFQLGIFWPQKRIKGNQSLPYLENDSKHVPVYYYYNTLTATNFMVIGLLSNKKNEKCRD
ncbi:Farnesyl diphosphate synthase 1 [Bulinus truncatus]|nr:Farnesyl diphosphate synthase 1 [Bulinus truncatus]